MAPETVQARGAIRARWPMLFGLLGALIGFLGSWRPSVWIDEVATVVSATRSWSSLWHEIHSVDAVHASYYALMHLWFEVVPYTPTTLRLPSAVATGIATGLVVVLADRLLSRTVFTGLERARFAGPVAAVVFIALPRVTWMATEGRSTAGTVMLALVTTLLLVSAVDRSLAGRSSYGWWIAFTIASIASSYLFIYGALVLVAQALTVTHLLVTRGSTARPDRRRLAVGFASSAVVTAIAVLPVVVLASAQTGQVSWIRRPGAATAYNVLEGQWFTENGQIALVGWILLAGGVVAVYRSRAASSRGVLTLLLSWLLVPTGLLLVISLVAKPIYVSRYVSFSAPAVALLIAALVIVIPYRWVAVGLLVALVALSIPTYIDQRESASKQPSDWGALAARLTTERAASGTGRQAVLFGPPLPGYGTSLRTIADGYPSAFRGLRDPGDRPGSGALWQDEGDLATSVTTLGHADTVWVFQLKSTPLDRRGSATALLSARGMRQVGRWSTADTSLIEYVR